MTITQKVYQVLSQNAGVIAAMGNVVTGGITQTPAMRIKPPGDWQSIGMPYVVHFAERCLPVNTMEGPITLRQWHYSVFVHGLQYSQLESVAYAVRDALTSYAGGNLVSQQQESNWYAGMDDTTRVQGIELSFIISEGL
jgi:hypothetical protein